MSVDREYRIRIATTADASGIRETNEHFEEGGKRLEQFNLHGHEAHKLFHLMDEALPGLGLALRAAFHPQNIGIGASVLLVHALIEKVGEYRQKLEEAAKAQAEMTTAVWEAQAERIRSCNEEMVQLNNKLQDAAKNTEALKEKEDQELAVLEAQIKAREKLAGTSEQAKATVDQHGFEQRMRILEDTQSENIMARLDAQVTLQQAQAANRAGAPKGDEAAAAAKWLEQHKGDVGTAQRRLDDAKREQQNFLDGRQLPPDWVSGNITKAEDALKDAKNQATARQAIVDAHNRATERLKKAEDDAAEEVQKYLKAIHELGVQIDKEKAVHAAEESGRIAFVLQQAGVRPGSKAGASVVRGIEAEGALGRGEALSADQAHDINVLYSGLVAAGAKRAELVKLFQEFMRSDIDTNQKIIDALNALKLSNQQIPHIKSTMPGSG